jgi:hypothetical protein
MESLQASFSELIDADVAILVTPGDFLATIKPLGLSELVSFRSILDQMIEDYAETHSLSE